MKSRIEREFQEYSSIQKLDNETYPIESSGTFNKARTPQNITLNRYRNVVPYDYNIIELDGFSPSYINASLIKTDDLNNQTYIFTQGPLDTTISHFWLMAWQNKCPAIIMLNRIYENGSCKCSPYFPENTDSSSLRKLDDVGLQIECLKKNVEHLVHHFNFTEWPDFGAPSSPEEYLDFLNVVRSTGAIDIGERPSIVHCSAGIGRSGTFAVIDIALKIVARDRSLENINVFNIIKDLRKCRAGVIQSPSQLRFCYMAILAGGQRFLESNLENDMQSNIEKEMPGTSNSNGVIEIQSAPLDMPSRPDAQTSTKTISYNTGRSEDHAETKIPSALLYESNSMSSESAESEPSLSPRSTSPSSRPATAPATSRNDPITSIPLDPSKSHCENESKLNVNHMTNDVDDIISGRACDNSPAKLDDDYYDTKDNNNVNSDPENTPFDENKNNENYNEINGNMNDSIGGDVFKPSGLESMSKVTPENLLKTQPNDDDEMPVEMDDTVDQEISRDDYNSETEYHLEKIHRRMKIFKMKPRRQVLPKFLRHHLTRILVHSNYIKTTKEAIKYFTIIAVVLISMLAFYLNQYRLKA